MATLDNSPATERHFTVAEVAQMWGISTAAVRRLFQDERGVLKLGHARVTRHISQSALERVYERRSRGWQQERKT